MKYHDPMCVSLCLCMCVCVGVRSYTSETENVGTTRTGEISIGTGVSKTHSCQDWGPQTRCWRQRRGAQTSRLPMHYGKVSRISLLLSLLKQVALKKRTCTTTQASQTLTVLITELQTTHREVTRLFLIAGGQGTTDGQLTMSDTVRAPSSH